MEFPTLSQDSAAHPAAAACSVLIAVVRFVRFGSGLLAVFLSEVETLWCLGSQTVVQYFGFPGFVLAHVCFGIPRLACCCLPLEELRPCGEVWIQSSNYSARQPLSALARFAPFQICISIHFFYSPRHTSTYSFLINSPPSTLVPTANPFHIFLPPPLSESVDLTG